MIDRPARPTGEVAGVRSDPHRDGSHRALEPAFGDSRIWRVQRAEKMRSVVSILQLA